MRGYKLLIPVLAIAAVATMPRQGICGDANAAVIFTIKAAGGHFQPSKLEVSANQPFKLQVTSAENAPIEFESFELQRERVVRPGETVTVNMPALSPGTYKFFDDFHRGTPEGAIIVR